MTLHLNKKILLALFKEQNRPLSLAEVVDLLPEKHPERTVRRWLSNMATAGLIVKIGNKRSTRYLRSNEAPILKSNKLARTIFSEESIEIIQQVRLPLISRKPVTYHPEWLEQYEPNVTTYLPAEIQQKLFKAGKRSKNYEPAGTYAHHIFKRLLIDLSYNSSRLEGNTYSLLDTQRLLIEGAGVEGKLNEEKIMILNHKEAIRYLVDNADKLKIDTITICTLQFLLGEGLVPNQYAGKVRDHGVRIGGSSYIPFENPAQLNEQLNHICNKANQINNPYEKSFFLLVHIAYLQAFVNINKRTARLSANIPLIQSNLVPLSFNDVEKDDYTSAMLAIYELNNINPLLDLYVFSYLRTCELYDATAESAGFDEVRIHYRRFRREIIRFIIENGLTYADIDDYINIHIPSEIKADHITKFIADIKEDLHLISPERIAGLGITLEQLERWLYLTSKNNSRSNK